MLFLNIPEIHRIEDASGDGTLETFSESLRQKFDNLRLRIRDWANLRDPLLCRTEFDEVVCLRLGKRVTTLGAFDRGGQDGYVTDLPALPIRFFSETGKFSERDIGKTLVVRGSGNARNNTSVAVVQVSTNKKISTIPALQLDTGPLKWELYDKVDTPKNQVTVEVYAGHLDRVTPSWVLTDGYQDYKLLSRRHFNAKSGLLYSEVLQSGEDMSQIVLGAFETTIRTVTGNFTQAHVGSVFITRGSSLSANNLNSYVKKVIAADKLVIGATMEVDPDSGALGWELRDGKKLGELTLFGSSIPRGVVEQDGNNLTIVSVGVSTSVVSTPTGNFSAADVLKRLSIFGADTDVNNLTVSVAGVNSLSELVIGTVLTLPEANNGSLYWELRSATGVECSGS